MVGSSFVSSDEVRRYNEAAFQEFLGLLGTRQDELLLRSAKVTAFAGEDTVQLGAQSPRQPAGWATLDTTLGAAALIRPDGTPTCYTAKHTSVVGMVAVPIVNMAFGDQAPAVTIELLLNESSSGVRGFFELGPIGSAAGHAQPAYQAWVNLYTAVVGTVGASLNVTVESLDSSLSPNDTWKRVTITFTPLGPRQALRFSLVTADLSTTSDTATTLNIASIRVLQSSPLKKLRGVRIDGSRFLRRAQLRDLEAYNLTGQSSAPECERYILKADNGREGMPELMLMPTPTSNLTLKYYFVPVFSLKDVGMMSLVAGWDEYVVITSAIKCKDKEESDTSVLFAERESLVKRMLEDLEPIDASDTPEVQRYTGLDVDPYSLQVEEEVF